MIERDNISKVVLPDEWNFTPLGYLFEIVGGNGFSPDLQGFTSGDLPFFKNSDISSGSTRVTSAANYISRQVASNEGFNVIPPRSILMGKIGESMKKNRRVLNTVACCIDNNMQAMVPVSHAIVPEYGVYALQLLDTSNFNNGGPVPSIDNAKWRRARIPQPPFQEQRLIATILDQETAKIDQGFALLTEQITTLEDYKKALIFETVTKGLDPTTPMKPSGVEWIGDIPEHWIITKVKYVAPSWNGLTYDPADLSETGTPVLRASNIQNGNLDLSDLKYVSCAVPPKARVSPGDMLICSRNGSKNLIGKNILITDDGFAFGAFMMVARPKVHPKYFYYLLNSGVFAYYLPTYLTSTVNQLTSANFGNMLIPICHSADEQKAIITFLDQKCETIIRAIANKSEQLELLKQQRQSLIFEYVTGKRRVSEGAEDAVR